MQQFAILAALLLPLCSIADIIHLADGRNLTGMVEEHEDSVTIHTKGGTVSIPRSDIGSIEKSAPLQDASRLPAWEQFMAPTTTSDWAVDIRQIPATVIDIGVLKNVPYMSYKAGDYEINLYGDPESPSGVEIGIRNALLESKTAKANCVAFMKAVLPLPQQQAVIDSLNLEKDAKESGGLSYEITPENDPDAYGGWWISVYSVKSLNAVRATEAELALITEKREAIEAAQPHQPEHRPEAVKPVVVESKPTVATTTPSPAWTQEDLRYARRIPHVERVYVRSFTRRGGSYAPAHVRMAPVRHR